MCVFVEKVLLIVLESAPWLDSLAIGYSLLCPTWMTSAAQTGTSCVFLVCLTDDFLPKLGLPAPD